MESIWTLVLASAIHAPLHRRALKTHARNDARAFLRQIDATSVPDPSEGQRRAKRIPGRSHVLLETLEIIVPGGRSPDARTYWAAYEMIVRGLQVTLEMREVRQEKVGIFMGIFGLLAHPTVISRMTYTTETFIPHLGAIDSFEAFGRYAPFRSDRTMKLSVHPDDLTDAYALLRDLGIRLSVLHHLDQHWWKDMDD